MWLLSLCIFGYVSIGLIFWSAMDGDPKDFGFADWLAIFFWPIIAGVFIIIGWLNGCLKLGKLIRRKVESYGQSRNETMDAQE